MNRIKFLELRDWLNGVREELLEVKGDAYSGEVDVLANFKRNAELMSMSKYQVWGVYAMKHVDAICSAIATNPKMPVDHSEGLEGRIVDALNYLELLMGLLVEDGLVNFQRSEVGDQKEEEMIRVGSRWKRVVQNVVSEYILTRPQQIYILISLKTGEPWAIQDGREPIDAFDGCFGEFERVVTERGF